MEKTRMLPALCRALLFGSETKSSSLTVKVHFIDV